AQGGQREGIRCGPRRHEEGGAVRLEKVAQQRRRPCRPRIVAVGRGVALVGPRQRFEGFGTNAGVGVAGELADGVWVRVTHDSSLRQRLLVRSSVQGMAAAPARAEGADDGTGQALPVADRLAQAAGQKNEVEPGTLLTAPPTPAMFVVTNAIDRFVSRRY